MTSSTSVEIESKTEKTSDDSESAASPEQPLKEVFDYHKDDQPPLRSRPEWNTICLGTLTILAILYTVYFARAVLMPLTMSLVLASLLHPVVLFSRRLRIPDAISAGVLLGGLLLALTLGIGTLVNPAMDWINNAPKYFDEARAKVETVQEKIKVIDKASRQFGKIANGEAATKIAGAKESSEEQKKADAQLAAESNPDVNSNDFNDFEPAGEMPTPEEPDTTRAEPNPDKPQDAKSALSESEDSAPSEKPVPVEVRQPRLMTGLSFLTSTGGVLAEILVTFVLAYFFLASGHVLLNNSLHLLPRLSEKRNVVELICGIEEGLSAYLFTITAVNFALGLIVAFTMWLFGLPNPLLWGTMATLFNFIPYLGALAGVGVLFVVSVLTFDSISFAFVPPLVYWGITLVEGSVVTPHLIGRSMSLNPIFVFVSLLFWGWMWGVGGALLAVPLLAVSKICLDQFERTRPLGILLGGRRTLVSSS